jgi:hypothetical protein
VVRDEFHDERRRRLDLVAPVLAAVVGAVLAALLGR